MNPSSTHKKVVVHKLDGELLKGYVSPKAYLGAEGVEFLDREGRRVTVPLQEVKGIYFVRDFEGNQRRAERKTFLSRPRLSGLWVRMTFKDHEVMDGLTSSNLLDLEPSGFLVSPPDLYSNNLKIFVPRSALEVMVVLGVISDGAARRSLRQTHPPRRKLEDTFRQMRLFSSTG